MFNYQIKHHQGILNFKIPKVMGIINLTPDSFTDGGLYTENLHAIKHAENLWKNGADILDLGAVSSRPGADFVSEEEEWKRLEPIIKILVNESYILSVDTVRPQIAKKALDLGIHIINDICAGESDGMFEICSQYQAPLILMHKKGEPQTMQHNPEYKDVTFEVFQYFNERIKKAHHNKCYELIIDLGFGFGKTVEHNFELLNNINVFTALELPILIGISRKSMISKTFNDSWENLTEVQESLHLQTLINGGNILRVHDVKLAKKTIELFQLLT